MPLVAVFAMSALIMAGCSSEDGSSEATTTVPAGGDAGASETTDPGAPDDTGSGDESGTGGTSGVMMIETDSGESWTLEQYRCLYQPDNEGRFVQLWTAGGTLPDGGEFVVQKATSPDPATPDEASVDGSLIDDSSGVNYVVIEGEAVSDGTTMTMTLGMHDSPNKIIGDPIDLTATVTCEL